MNKDNSDTIDDSLYSRQRYVLGDVAMKKLGKGSVLLSGLGGLGVEIAKNLVLAGPRAVTLNDVAPATVEDLATQFYINPEDIGKNRAVVSSPRVAELNPYVQISTSTDDLSSVPLSFFDVFTSVVLCDVVDQDFLFKINDYCHQKGIHFVVAEARGAFAYAFTDFGDNFEIHDTNGEEPLETFIQNISSSRPAVVTSMEHMRHGLETGDSVQFRELVGMDALMNGVYKVTVLSPYTFSVDVDGASMASYVRGGIAIQVKTTTTMTFQTMRASIAQPNILINDFAKMDTPATLHKAFQALHRWSGGKNLPRTWNEEDASNVVALAHAIGAHEAHESHEQADVIIRNLAYTARGGLSPITAFMGGFVGQEVVKGLTGKFTPLNQWFYFDASEVVPVHGNMHHLSQGTPQEIVSASGLSSPRAYGQLLVLGQDVCRRLEELHVFTVGSGAIGCEMLKNYALLGVATAPTGRIDVTDNDLIEKSNLNRQFLFRNRDIQSPKSVTAAREATAMNPAMHIIAHQLKAEPATENVFTDTFFTNQDVVVNALDNVGARTYIDRRIVANQRPLLESGTLGTKGHVQVILPHLTESYESTRDPPEKDIPFCTLKSFPANLDHCIQWARDKFQNMFVDKPSEANKTFDNDNYEEYLTQGGARPSAVRHLLKLIDNRASSFDQCLLVARNKFATYFANSIHTLLRSHPVDQMTADGIPFWTLPKRPPTPLVFNPEDSAHLDFVIATALLWAHVFKLEVPAEAVAASTNGKAVALNRDWVIRELAKFGPMPEYVPKHKRIETDPKAEKPVEQDDPAELKRLLEMLRGRLDAIYVSQEDGKGGKGKQAESKSVLGGLAYDRTFLEVEEFEKDDDTNHHIDFIAATANLRARNYSIQEGERLRIKRIAGRIIPAIATTTSAVSGLVALELVKIATPSNLPLDKYKNCFMNLALPFFALSEPGGVTRSPVTKTVSLTLWDKWEVRGPDLTVHQFVQWFEEKFKLEVVGIFQDVMMIYMPLLPTHRKRLTQKLASLIQKPIGDEKYVPLIVSFAADDDGQEPTGPPVRYWFE